MEDQPKNFYTEIELLKRDFSTVDKYFSKIDSTLEKIGDAVGQITKIISLHDERIQNSQREEAEIKILIETLHTETTLSINEMNTKIENGSNRINSLERWRWGIVVGAIVAMFFIGHAYDSIINNKLDPQSIQIQNTIPRSPDQIKMDQINVENQKKVDQMNLDNQKKVEATAAKVSAQPKIVAPVVVVVQESKTDTAKETTKTTKTKK